jgi:uncharacterized protein (DUF433 family)
MFALMNQWHEIRSRGNWRWDAEGFLEILISTQYHRLGYAKEFDMEQLDRITQQPEVMGGKACIRGMRVTVGMIVGQIGAGHSIEELLADYPYLEREDIMQALRYAAWRAEEREIALATI